MYGPPMAVGGRVEGGQEEEAFPVEGKWNVAGKLLVIVEKVDPKRLLEQPTNPRNVYKVEMSTK